MIFIIEILGEPDRHGNARVIERRTHTGPTISEALRTARANLRTPPPSAYSFSMKANGKEVGSWQWSGDGNKTDVVADIESARSRSRTESYRQFLVTAGPVRRRRFRADGRSAW